MAKASEHGWRRISGLLSATLLLVVTGVLGGTAAAGEALPGEPNPPWDDGALPAQVVPGLEDIRPVRWDHVLVAPDGQTMAVYFTAGPPECEALADVRAEYVDGEVRIQLRVGEVPGVEVCPAIAQLYRVVVVVDQRVIIGGSILDVPSG